MTRPNPRRLFPPLRYPGDSAGVMFPTAQRAYSTAIARLVESVRLRDLVDVRERADLDRKIVASVIALGRARASGQLFVVPCAEADRLVNIAAVRCAPTPDPRADDLIPVGVAEALPDKTDHNDPAMSVLHEEE